ncbi:MAG: organomercurial lyase [Vicinamibacterales bacterium]
MTGLSARDLQVRRAVLNAFAGGGVPTRAAVAATLGVDLDEVAVSYRALADAHVLVPDPATGEAWMAMPFSAVPTEFRVVVDGRSVWANCAWDAFGVAAALDADVEFITRCPASDRPVRAGVRRGVAFADPGAVGHVEVPASRWWDDIGYT